MMYNKIQTDSVRSVLKKSKILGSHDRRVPPHREAAAENTSTNGTSTDHISANGASTDHTSANGASTDHTSANGVFANHTPANGTSTDHTPANGTSTNGTCTSGTSANGASTDHISANGTSINGTSSNHGSVSRKSVFIAGLILLLFALHIGAVLCYSAVSGSGQDSLQLRLEASPLTADAVKQLTESKELNAKLEETAPANVPLYTAWTQKNKMTLQNLRLGRKSTADVIFYTGDNNSRFRLTLDNGCAITDELAFQLWGVGDGTEILGSSLRIGGQDYIVEQILPSGKWTKGWTDGTVLARYQAGSESAQAQGGGSTSASQSSDVPHSSQGNDVPHSSQNSDAPHFSQGGDVPHSSQNGDAPYSSQDGSASSHSPAGSDPITFDVLEIHSPSGQLVSPEEIIAAGNLKNVFPLDFRQLQSMLASLRVLPIWCGAVFLAVFWISTAARKRAEALSKVQEEGRILSDTERSMAENLRGKEEGTPLPRHGVKRRPLRNTAANWRQLPGRAAKWNNMFRKTAAKWRPLRKTAANRQPLPGNAAKWHMLRKTTAKWQPLLGTAVKWRGVPWLGGILLIALTGFLFGSPFLIPQSFIPTRWSDFSFWGAKLEAAGEWFHKLATMAYYGPDVYFRQEAVGMILCCAGEGILVCVLLRLFFSQDRRHGLSYR